MLIVVGLHATFFGVDTLAGKGPPVYRGLGGHDRWVKSTFWNENEHTELSLWLAAQMGGKDRRVSGAVEFRVGTASWTDPTLVNSDLFYPPSARSAEERLRFYAEQFNTVEVDSTYYALPAERNANLWAERTPAGFLFNIKPFALMTQHPAEVSRLPKQLREMLPEQERSNRQLTRPSKGVVDVAFQMFWSAMAPLREAGKLGMLAFQFPPYFVPKPANFDYLASLRERLPGASIAIEFRHPSWVRDETRRTETMNFLRSHGLFYISIDAPEDNSIVPSFIEATGDQVYVRIHGKNRENWFKRNIM